jgi:aspartyl-tRNA(Asn)/glutamyl-tRNA(Gln) amidotransferase subunit A
MQPYELTIAGAQRAMEGGVLTAVDLAESCLTRIEELDGDLNAFITVDRDGALRQAREADTRRRDGNGGALCGIPLAVKDLICTRGLVTTCGSKMLEHFVPPFDATVVARLRREGCVVLGKTTMDEFAMGSTSETCAFRVPRNPWKKGYVAGGSSGGSAVAVAAGLCPVALGSDTGGSIRQPASLCGVVGMKPTYGRVSRYGLTAFASSLDQIGPFSRTVEDCALLMNAISGHDPLDSTSVRQEVPDFTGALRDGLAGVRIGIPKEYFGAGLDPEVGTMVSRAMAVLREMGAELVEVSLPHTDYCVAVYYLIAPSEACSNLARYDGVLYGYREAGAKTLQEMYTSTRSKGFGAEVKRRILIGTYALSSGYYEAYYRKASQVRTLILKDYQQAFTRCDLLVSPVSPTPAWPMGKNSNDPLSLYLSDILTLSANLAGIPGMSVPAGFTGSGLPVGVQLQGPHFAEAMLLRVAYNLERSCSIERRTLDL